VRAVTEPLGRGGSSPKYSAFTAPLSHSFFCSSLAWEGAWERAWESAWEGAWERAWESARAGGARSGVVQRGGGVGRRAVSGLGRAGVAGLGQGVSGVGQGGGGGVGQGGQRARHYAALWPLAHQSIAQRSKGRGAAVRARLCGSQGELPYQGIHT
jgi:hypothetical protein